VFGLKHVRSTFQWAMSCAFDDIKHIIEAYLDDLIVWSKHCVDHPFCLCVVFTRCQHYNICLNPHKCIFYVISKRLLGFIVCNFGIIIDLLKVEAIVQWIPSHNISQNQSLQGKKNFLQRFVVNYTEITKGFMHLLIKGVPFVWDSQAQCSLKALMKALFPIPLLRPWNYNKIFLLYLVAFESTIGMVLVQVDN